MSLIAAGTVRKAQIKHCMSANSVTLTSHITLVLICTSDVSVSLALLVITRDVGLIVAAFYVRYISIAKPVSNFHTCSILFRSWWQGQKSFN